jgi:tetratricopeptide (TPR) repeat protein
MSKYLFQFTIIGLFLTAFSINAQVNSDAQKARLCNEYYNNGEFQKAAECFKDLHEKDKVQDFYYDKYLSCLLELQQFDDADKMIRKAIKAAPDKVERYVHLGSTLEKMRKNPEAKEQFDKAVKLLPASQVQINILATAFNNIKKYDFALQTYEKGEKLLKEKSIFSYEMAGIYRDKGDAVKMTECYLNALELMPTRLTNIQAFMQRYLPEMTGSYDELKKQLYARMQKDPSGTLYPELLIWVYILENDFESALTQSKALDKRLDENGTRIFKLAQMALNEKQYDEAILCFEYITKEKGKSCYYYIESKQQLLATRLTMLTAGFNYTKDEIKILENEYETFLDEFGKSKKTAYIMQELAQLEAFYLNNLPKSIKIMEELIAIPMLDRNLLADSKIKLGDFYLMLGEIWEASLFYSQVDKEMKDAPLGEMARYKNAKLSYYKGDFEWAQDQLDVLKGSTSELISNDAIDVSVFIMEHLNLDTGATSMRFFAEADLLLFQNRFDEAFDKMDSLLVKFPTHGLGDDVYYAKAKIFIRKRQFDKALELLGKITEEYKDGILIDNALFKMAEIQETELKNKTKAMELYEKILMDFSGSTFTVEARKRFRKLRGDGV